MGSMNNKRRELNGESRKKGMIEQRKKNGEEKGGEVDPQEGLPGKERLVKGWKRMALFTFKALEDLEEGLTVERPL